ncbi:MAG: hypothetical protein HUJ63_11930 [Enterococcus sp.]|nr:hypothetical protein [Enterococcus sp.]
MKWGVRRYQNYDGTYTNSGRERYDIAKKNYKSAKKEYTKSFNKAYNKNYQSLSPLKKHREASTKRWEEAYDKAAQLRTAKKEYKQVKKETGNQFDTDKLKTAAKIGAAVAGTALAAYGTYKMANVIQVSRKTKAFRMAQEYVDDNFLRTVGKVTTGGKTHFTWMTKGGEPLTSSEPYMRGIVGDANARTMSRAKSMYKNLTNTKFDRGIGKIVNAGDKVGYAIKNPGDVKRKAVKTYHRRKVDRLLKK